MNKNLLLLIICLLTGFISSAQVVFNNDGGNGDQLYSTVTNWRVGGAATSSLPSSTEYAQLNGTPLLDISSTVASLRGVIATCGLANDGDHTITVTGNIDPTPGFGNFSIWGNNGGALTFDVKMVLAAGTNHVIKVDDGSGSTGSIVFDENSELTVNQLTDLETSATGTIFFNGALKASAANFRLDGGPNVTFGSTSDNSEFGRDFVFISGASGTLTANTADNGTFIASGQKIQVNGSNGKAVVNGSNVYKGLIAIAGSNSFRMEVNADQPSIQAFNIGAGALTLAIGENVGSIAVGSVSWTTGTLTIENFQSGVLRFGSDASALTAGQLSQISIGGGTVFLDADGYLIASDDQLWDGNSWTVVPTPADNAVISGAYSAGSLELNNLTIQAGSTVSIAAGETLTVNGNLVNQGNLNIASGGALVLAGSSYGDATIVRSTTGSDGYSIVGAPVTGTSVASIIAQGATQVFDYDGTEYVAISDGEMMPGKGYFVAQVGETSPSLSFTGAMISGDVNTTVSGDGDGFTILANPYATAISPSAFIASDAATMVTTGSVYIWDDGGSNDGTLRAGTYRVANITTSDFSAIGAVQGFYVQAGNGGDVTFTAGMQDGTAGANSDASFYRQTENRQVLKLSISGNQLHHETVVSFMEGATLGRDYAMDAQYLKGNDLISFYSKMDNTKFATQGFPIVQDEPFEVDLGMDLAESGTYVLAVDEFVGFSNDLLISLVDNLTGISYPLDAESSISFSTDAVVNADRFQLVFTPANILSTPSLEGLEIVMLTNGVNLLAPVGETLSGTLEILDVQGRLLKEHAFSSNQSELNIPFSFDSNRIYIVRTSMNGTVESRKIIFK